MNNWERRWHPLLQEWVILAATTNDRPWSGAKVVPHEENKPVFDAKCYLCPGVTRASGVKNPDYKGVFAFTNDFSSFSFDAPKVYKNDPLEKAEPAHGICRVICFSPKHNITMPELDENDFLDVISIWKEEFSNLSTNKGIKNILIFENKGTVIGVSNPHPHGQIYATGYVPRIVQTQMNSFNEYKKEKGTCLMCDLVQNEIKHKSRIVAENDHFVAFIPYFARFVYETYIVPKRHVSTINELSEEECNSWMKIHREVIIKFDNLYLMSFPNITMLQNAPVNQEKPTDNFHFHVEFYPPMRAPEKLKYLAGFESGGGNIINPILPEIAAESLREASSVHYKTE